MDILPLALLFLFKAALKSKNKTIPGASAPPKKTATAPIQKQARPKDAAGASAYLEKLAILESGPNQPNWQARRPNSQYWGRWQLGRLARNGPPNEPASKWAARRVTWTKFKSDPAIQTAAAVNWARRAYQELRRSRTAANAVRAGNLHGVPVTWSGLVGMDHLVGRGAVLKWIRTGEDTKDANGVAGSSYLRRLGGFNLSAWNPSKPAKPKGGSDA